MLSCQVSLKVTDVSEVLAASIMGVIMEAANISETSVNSYQNEWCNIPEKSFLT
jgi:hypothetical protein